MSRERHVPSHLFSPGVSLLPEDFPARLTALKEITGLTWEGMSVCLGVDPRQLKYWRDGGWPNGGAMLALVALATRVPGGLGALLNNEDMMVVFRRRRQTMGERNRAEDCPAELFPKDFGDRLERLIELAGLSLGGVRPDHGRRARPRDGVARGEDPYRRGGVAHHESGAVCARRIRNHASSRPPGRTRAGSNDVVRRQRWVYRIEPSRFPPDFPERLERFMEAAELSSRGLARLLHVDNRMLRRWRKNGTQPDPGHLVALFTLAAEMGLLHILLPAAGDSEGAKPQAA